MPFFDNKRVKACLIVVVTFIWLVMNMNEITSLFYFSWEASLMVTICWPPLLGQSLWALCWTLPFPCLSCFVAPIGSIPLWVISLQVVVCLHVQIKKEGCVLQKPAEIDIESIFIVACDLPVLLVKGLSSSSSSSNPTSPNYIGVGYLNSVSPFWYIWCQIPR